MDTIFCELIETLDRLSVVYDELLETAKEKQHCLISGNTEELEMLLYEEKNRAEIAQLLEEKRQNILNRYCIEHDVQGNNITMKSLMNEMDDLQSKRIANLIDKLTRSLKQLQEVNKVNTTLTSYSLEITEDIMKIFCHPAFQYPVYQYTGKIQENTFPRILVDTEI